MKARLELHYFIAWLIYTVVTMAVGFFIVSGVFFGSGSLSENPTFALYAYYAGVLFHFAFSYLFFRALVKHYLVRISAKKPPSNI
jgi:hypothetical protein